MVFHKDDILRESCRAMLTLTLDNEASAALEVAHHSCVHSLFAVVHVLDNQFVGLLLREHPVVLVWLQLHVVEHPFHRNIILRDTQLKYGSCTQQ